MNEDKETITKLENELERLSTINLKNNNSDNNKIKKSYLYLNSDEEDELAKAKENMIKNQKNKKEKNSELSIYLEKIKKENDTKKGNDLSDFNKNEIIQKEIYTKNKIIENSKLRIKKLNLGENKKKNKNINNININTINEKKISDMDNQINELNKNIELQKKELLDNKEKINKMYNENLELKKEIENKKKIKEDNINEQMLNMKKEKLLLEKEVKEQNDKIKKNQNEINEHKSKITTLEFERNDYKKKIKEYEDKMKEYKENIKNNDEASKKFKDIKNRLLLEIEKKQKDFENQKKILKQEWEKTIGEQYKNEMNSQINVLKNRFSQEMKNNIEKIQNDIKRKYEQKDHQIEQKLNEMSEIAMKSGIGKNEDINLSICNTVHLGIKCNQCFKIPIEGYRYQCSQCKDYNLCQKCEEKNAVSETHPHDFIKIRKQQNNNNNTQLLGNKYNNDIINNYIKKDNDNDNKNENDNFNILDEDDENQENKKYSYDCSNIMILVAYIYQGTDECKFSITLKNNGKQSWPDGAKLIYDKNSSFVGDSIMLNPQKPGDSCNYSAIVKDLGQRQVGEYKAYLLFYVDGERYGEKLLLKIIIKEKKETNDDKYLKKIEEFRDNFGLNEDEYDNEKLLEVLKKADFEFERAFEILFE